MRKEEILLKDGQKINFLKENSNIKLELNSAIHEFCKIFVSI
jgi:hypothetical protein